MDVRTVSPTSAPSPAESVLPSLKGSATTGIDPQNQSVETVVVESDPVVVPESLRSAKPAASEEIPALRYDAVAIAQLYRRRPLRVWGRLVGIIWPFIIFTLSLWSLLRSEIFRCALLRILNAILRIVKPGYL